MSEHLYDEGHTVAGWAGFGIATVGSAVVGAGVIMASGPVVGGGLALVAVSVLATWVLHLTGWGKPPGHRPRQQWGMGVRDPQARSGHPGCVGCRLAGRGQRATAVATTVPGMGEAEPAAADSAG